MSIPVLFSVWSLNGIPDDANDNVEEIEMLGVESNNDSESNKQLIEDVTWDDEDIW